MRGGVVFVVALGLAVPVASALPGSGPVVLVPNQGPDAAMVGLPVATIKPIQHFLHSGDFVHRVALDVPDMDWNRVQLIFHSKPNGDPWDRTFILGFMNTEILHGTTTRGDFTVKEDVTEYSMLLRGGAPDVWTRVDSWVCCGIFVDVTLEFYNDPTYPAQEQAFDVVASPFLMRGLGGSVSTSFGFPAETPASGTIELFTSGHSQNGEFWYLNLLGQPSFPRFQIYVDDVHVGTVHAMPYVYAFFGFCCGPVTETVNQVLWGPAQTAQEAAGVHFISGEIPSYRAEIPDDVLPLLSGTHDVRIVKETHGGYWPTSLNLLLEYGSGAA